MSALATRGKHRNLGNLPTHANGLNANKLDRKALANLKDLTGREIAKAYNNWIQIFWIEESTLTFEEYLNKLEEIGITPSSVGTKLQDYQLARFGDTGAYTKENCRFITMKDNLNEEKRQSIYLRMITKYGKKNTRKMLTQAGRIGGLRGRVAE